MKLEQAASFAKNHGPSAKSKAGPAKHIAVPANSKRSSLVFLKDDGDKTSRWELYIVSSIKYNHVILQKMNGTKFMSRSYEVSLTKSYPATVASNNRYYDPHQRDQSSFDSTDEDVAFKLYANTRYSQRERRTPGYLDDYELERS